MPNMTWFIKLIIAINIVAFLTMAYDKFQARRHGWRISEFTLMALAVFLGAVGVWAGMYFFRHKTMHALFKYGVPLALCLNLLILYYLLF